MNTSDNPYTARITPKGRSYDRVEFVTGPDETVFVSCNVEHYDGRISWADDWAKLEDLERAGVCGHTFQNGHGNPYGQNVTWFYL